MQNSRYALAGFAAVVIVGGLVAYCSMVPQKAETPQQAPVSEPAPAVKPEVKTEAAPEVKTEVAPEIKPETPVEEKPAEPKQAVTQAVTVPVFDVLRLEGDGSLVVAGKAAPNSQVDVISKTRILGSTKASENGDFAIVLDQALKSGDYQLVLRATAVDNSVATSQQTAILSVPSTPDGQVLALVEEPGQASRMITTPKAMPVTKQSEGIDVPITQHGNSASSSVLPPESVQGGSAGKSVKSDIKISVEAVEIEGTSIFIAGHALGGQTVNVSANELLLGTAIITPEGRYLVQTQQPLAVGDYIIRADLMDKGGKILATARVPFRREAGENIAAVAPVIAEQPDAQEEQAQPLEKAEGSVIIRKGDNLWKISKRTYGSGMRYTTIYLANTDQIKNPDLIWPGQVFVMPKEPLSDQEVQQKQR